MADKAALVIDVTPEERRQIEDLARQRGFDAPADYLLALVASDAHADELTKEEVLANLRQGLQEAIHGEVHPIDTLWDGLDDE